MGGSQDNGIKTIKREAQDNNRPFPAKREKRASNVRERSSPDILRYRLSCHQQHTTPHLFASERGGERECVVMFSQTGQEKVMMIPTAAGNHHHTTRERRRQKNEHRQ